MTRLCTPVHVNPPRITAVDYILIVKKDVEHKNNPNEVENAKYVSKAELQAMFESAEREGTLLTPWFRLVVENFLYKWWDQLDSLPPNDGLVHKMVKDE